MQRRFGTAITTLGLVATLSLVAGCNVQPGTQAGTAASTQTAPARAGAGPVGTTASGQSAATPFTTGGPNQIDRGYNLGGSGSAPTMGSGAANSAGP